MNWLLILFSVFLGLLPDAQSTDCAMTAWNQRVDALPDPAYPERMRTGDEFTLVGIVRDAETCLPIVNAAVMFDLTNAQGEYDGVQQGTVYTNALGLYIIQTNRPGAYGGGPPHIHLFVGADEYSPLTTAYNFLGDETWGRVDVLLPR